MIYSREFAEGVGVWGNASLDKLTFRLHKDLLRKERAVFYKKKGLVSITDAGGAYRDICLHAEGLNPCVSMAGNIRFHFAALAIDGVFQPWIAFPILWSYYGLGDDTYDSTTFLLLLESLDISWVGIEAAWDFDQQKRPIIVRDESQATYCSTTLYTPDRTRYFRTVRLGEETRRESKGRRNSFLTEYNRAKKLKHIEPCWRIELRLQRHHVCRLSALDLCFAYFEWLYVRQSMLAKFLRRAVKPGAYQIRPGSLKEGHVMLLPIIEQAGWSI